MLAEWIPHGRGATNRKKKEKEEEEEEREKERPTKRPTDMTATTVTGPDIGASLLESRLVTTSSREGLLPVTTTTTVLPTPTTPTPIFVCDRTQPFFPRCIPQTHAQLRLRAAAATGTAGTTWTGPIEYETKEICLAHCKPPPLFLLPEYPTQMIAEFTGVPGVAAATRASPEMKRLFGGTVGQLQKRYEDLKNRPGSELVAVPMGLRQRVRLAIAPEPGEEEETKVVLAGRHRYPWYCDPPLLQPLFLRIMAGQTFSDRTWLNNFKTLLESCDPRPGASSQLIWQVVTWWIDPPPTPGDPRYLSPVAAGAYALWLDRHVPGLILGARSEGRSLDPLLPMVVQPMFNLPNVMDRLVRTLHRAGIATRDTLSAHQAIWNALSAAVDQRLYFAIESLATRYLTPALLSQWITLRQEERKTPSVLNPFLPKFLVTTTTMTTAADAEAKRRTDDTAVPLDDMVWTTLDRFQPVLESAAMHPLLLRMLEEAQTLGWTTTRDRLAEWLVVGDE